MLKMCACCGNAFDAESREQRFCYPCRKRHKEKPPVNMKERTCPICGADFVPVNGQQKYCSLECRMEQNRRKMLKAYHRKKQESKQCVICGKTFLPRKRTQTTCCAECREERQRRYIAEYYAGRKTADAPKKKGRKKKVASQDIKTEWWMRYTRQDRLGKDAMLARRFGFESYGALQTAIAAGKVSRNALELTAMQQERENNK